MRNGRVTTLPSVAGILFLIAPFAITGCRVRGERLAALASYKQIEMDAHGEIFMEMVVAYYDQSPSAVSRYHNQSASFIEKLDTGAITNHERRAMVALLSIQAVDQSITKPPDEMIQSWTQQQIWNQLSIKSRRAFFMVF